MSTAAAALVGAVVGSLASVFAVLVSGLLAAKAERVRRDSDQHVAVVQLIRTQAAEVFSLMMAVEFQIDSVCWLAEHAPARVNESLIGRYEEHMQVLLPRLGGAMATLAALDLDVYDRLRSWVDDLDRLDGDVARLLYGPITDRTKSELATLHTQTISFYHRLPVELGAVIMSIGRVKAG